MNSNWKLALVVLCGPLLLSAPSAGADGSTPSDFDFLEGQWSIVYNNAQPGYPHDVHGSWIGEKRNGGRVLEDEFRLVDSSGTTVALGATYRAFDHSRGQWDMRYLSLFRARPGAEPEETAQWAELTSRRAGSEVIVDQTAGDRRLHITYYDIGKDHFSWKADVSSDGGKTWKVNQIRIEATKSSP